ncbi:unnamed protein product [Caenorhabditis nigoni]
MDDTVIKEEVNEEDFNFTFKNNEFGEVKQEEIERKPEHLLEKDIKAEPIDFSEDVKLEPEEIDSKVTKRFAEVTILKCGICQKMMPRNLLKLIISEENKTVLSEMFKIEGSLETRQSYVCVSHIQAIIGENDGKLKSASTPSEKLLRSFITRNKYMMKDKTSQRRYCRVCHKAKEFSEAYQISSKGTRIVLMVGCILRGTHSIDQAVSYITNTTGVTCHSHCKESIDRIFEHFGIKNIQGLSMCSTQAMDELMDIVKKIDSNFTINRFIDAFNRLSAKK